MIEAVLFDVGGPLDLEVAHEARVDARIVETLTEAGIEVTGEALKAAGDWAVEVFAPNAYLAMLWRLAGPKLGPRVTRAWGAWAGPPLPIEPRPGVAEMLAALRARGLKLGLVANQPARTVQRLAAAGLGGFFEGSETSGDHGWRKPDVRVFLRACERLGVAPDACVMVGDRIDCDVAPARLLGMRTVRLVYGRHAAQQPRWAGEVPDAEATDTAAMAAAIERMLA